jgi:CheY-like chemotaxis protein
MPQPVMVVEDDEKTCTGLVEILRLEQISGVAAPNGAAAIDRFYEGLHPCVILPDPSMPLIRGEQFLKGRRLSPALGPGARADHHRQGGRSRPKSSST